MRDTDDMRGWRWLAVFCPPEFAAFFERYDEVLAARAMAARIDHRPDERVTTQPTTMRRRLVTALGGVSWARCPRIGNLTGNR